MICSSWGGLDNRDHAHSPLYQGRNVHKTDSLLQEKPHRRLVCSIQDRGGSAAGTRRLHCNRQAGERLTVGHSKGKRRTVQQVQRSGRSDRAFRPGEGILDGKAHIRRAQLCQHRIITVFHQGVNYTLPVDHNGNFLGRHPVESHSFDELKPFIHQGGGVHGDLGSHGPVGMLQRLGQRHLPELLPAPSIEGSSGSGEDETAHFPSVSAALKALENSRMFRIHRHDLRPAASASSITSCPAHTIVSLLANAIRFPRLTAH